MISPSNEFLTAALAYAANGWRVFPVKPGAKTPITKHGFKDASTDGDRLRAWWRRWPTANIGLATGRASGIWVLDVDGDRGLTTLAALEASHEPLPASQRVRTGSGGLHVYFRYPKPGTEIYNSAGQVGLGIDVRGKGGYVVAPPSIHPNGSRYVWVTP